MSQRDFNNNTGNITDIYNSQNATNLVVSSLPTKTYVDTSIATNNLLYTPTSGINTLLSSTIASQVIARDLAVTTAINNNNLLYSTTVATNSAINTAISLNNTSNIAYTNTSIATAISNEIVRANASIITNNTALLSTIKTYSVDQNFININLTGKLNFTVLSDGSTSLGFNNTTASQCTTIGANAASVAGIMNSVCIGFSSKNYGGGSVSVGSYATTYNNSVSIGYNSGNQSNSNNSYNTYIGYNANIPYSTSYSNSCAIGYNSVINSSNTIQLGRDLLDTTNCYALTTTNLTGINLNSTNLSSINIISSNIISNGIVTYNYSVLPLLTSYKVNGFSSSINNIKNIALYDTFYNCSAITLPCGVYYINYYYNINYSVGQVNYWLNYGLGSTASIIDIQANKSYCSSNTSNVYNCANSYCFTSTNGSVLYQNVMMNSFDNTIPVVNLANFTFSSRITATRVA